MLKLSLVIVLIVATNLVVGAKLKNLQEPSFPDGRIINGNNAQRGEAPYIVSLRSSTSHFCAGSIIDPHWVLTAAHCLTNPLNIILAGLHNRNDESQVQVRYVTKALTIQHELYDGNVGPNDIGLIYISHPFNLTASQRDGTPVVSQIALPSGNHELTGEGQLFGWGIDNSGWLSNTLQTLNVNIINYTDCKQKLPQDAPVAPVNICTANENPVDGACNGDSGGPLVRNTADGPELVGIVSWGYTPCIITDYPSVYTSTASYIDWIKRQIAEFVNPFA